MASGLTAAAAACEAADFDIDAADTALALVGGRGERGVAAVGLARDLGVRGDFGAPGGLSVGPAQVLSWSRSGCREGRAGDDGGAVAAVGRVDV